MDSVEKIGLMPVKTWNDEINRPGGNFGGLHPREIGVLGPINLGDIGVLMMACDEHMQSEERSDEPLYALAERHADLSARVAHRLKLYADPEYNRKYNTSTKKQHKERLDEMLAELNDMRADVNFPRSALYYSVRRWFIENAVWTEVP